MDTILYVDDEPINLSVFSINFRKYFNVITAENANEGIEVLNNDQNIGIVISDMKMPGMNGLEFITLIKQLRPRLNCFILSGYEKTKEIQEAINSKLVLEYFIKPLQTKDIINKIGYHIDR